MTELIKNFFEFIYDRQEIWHRRNFLALPAPWTQDSILRDYKFCNVYRELDAGTLAIKKYICDMTLPPQTRLFTLTAYRFFNRRDTVENLFGGALEPHNFNFTALEQRFDTIKQQENIFSNAYLITSHPYDKQYRPHDKHIQILLMLKDLAGKIETYYHDLYNSTPKNGLEIIKHHVPMAGPFLSGQILLDASYATDLVSYTADDFLIVGPGAHWGLNIIFQDKLSKKEADAKCRYLYAIQEQEFSALKKRCGKDWQQVRWKNADYPNAPYLCLHDIQNSLCEFRKYWRLKNNEKAKKRYFKADF